MTLALTSVSDVEQHGHEDVVNQSQGEAVCEQGRPRPPGGPAAGTLGEQQPHHRLHGKQKPNSADSSVEQYKEESSSPVAVKNIIIFN